MLARALDHPVELVQHLADPGRLGAAPQHLLEEPRVPQRAAGEHHGGGAGARVGVVDGGGAVQPAAEDHGHRERAHELRGELVIGRPAMRGARRAGVHRDRRDPGVLDEPACELDAVTLAPAPAGAQLDGDREAAAGSGCAGDRHGPRGVGQQRRAGTRAADLGHRAAHVDVDHVRAGRGGPLRGRAHHRGVGAEQLDRDGAAGALTRVDVQQLAQRARVVVVDREARDHLRDHETRAVAARLQAHEPVADPGERRKHDAVGQLDPADRKALCQRSHPPRVVCGAMDEQRAVAVVIAAGGSGGRDVPRSLIVLAGASDFVLGSFWSAQAMPTSLIASLIVLAVTVVVLNEWLERRDRRRWSVLAQYVRFQLVQAARATWTALGELILGQRLSSQIRRSPSRVSRSSTTSIVAVNAGTR